MAGQGRGDIAGHESRHQLDALLRPPGFSISNPPSSQDSPFRAICPPQQYGSGQCTVAVHRRRHHRMGGDNVWVLLAVVGLPAHTCQQQLLWVYQLLCVPTAHWRGQWAMPCCLALATGVPRRAPAASSRQAPARVAVGPMCHTLDTHHHILALLSNQPATLGCSSAPIRSPSPIREEGLGNPAT